MTDLLPCPFCGETPFPISTGMAGQPRWQHPNTDTCPIAGHYLGGWNMPEQWNRRTALTTGKEVMPVAKFNHTSDIGPGDQAVAGAAPVTTADMVKDLREKTGAGMVDAKRALTECLGDMDEAIEWLRFKGTSRPYIPKHKRLQAVAALTGKEPSHE